MVPGSLRIAKVTKVYPEAHAVDLIYLDNKATAPLVQVMGGGSSNTGHVDLPEPTPSSDPQSVQPTKDRDMYAVVAFIGAGIPLVMGFLTPQVSQVLFKGRPNFRVNRHASDVYSTLEDDGAFTMAWPNGTYIKVGEDNALEDLAGQDFDQKWDVKRNKDKGPKVRLRVNDASGAQKALFDIDAATGDVAMTIAGNLTQTVTGNLVQEVTGDATVTVHGDASLTIDGALTSSANSWTHTGPVTFEDNVTVNADMTASGTVTGTTEVKAGTKALKAHVHSGVTVGGGNTGNNV